MAEHDVEEIWQLVWRPVLYKGHHPFLDLEQVKRELYDYYQLRQRYDELEQDFARLEEEVALFMPEWNID